MKINTFPGVGSRWQLERNMFLLEERMRQGRICFMEGVSTEDLQAVRRLPNGRVNLLSINESTRLLANMQNTTNMFDSEQ